jgi:DNA replication protein DnaC
MNNELIALAKQFRISVLRTGEFAVEPGLSNEEYLLAVLRAEAKARDARAEAERVKQAHLPSFKGFEEFDTDFQKGVTVKQLQTLANLEWLDALFNLILIGPPRTGKTHIALAIGNKAVRDGYKVFFSTMDNLVHILKTVEISQKSAARVRWIHKCDLIIIDEMGYLPVSKVEANLFFGLISQLYENASVIITSNKGFDGWADILGDIILATALLDRLTHRCQVLSFSDESYRLAHRKQLFSTEVNAQ